ncbi:ABC transporter ATP-binding protein [Caulobacter vibrioides]|uniref:ABC transporter ATP-binding protein n=1 Tax=Caulobacter vibrioides TaxID=155892 RepID=A0A290MX21_CAUVI|nr:ABC transporter ATP-binding protein [Caulobacter vibrioides]ATC32162.1 ABC transporter ATP-binding protein [Caulobacter vibrioides]
MTMLSADIEPPARDLAYGDAGFAVATRALCKRYGRSTALTDIDLLVPEGAVYMLAGENGAGKSTLLRLLLNLQRPTGGQAEIAGLPCNQHGARVRARVGYVPEGFDIGPRWMSVGRCFAERAVYYPAWDAKYAAALCRRLDVDVSRRIGQLSKGLVRRAQIIAALAHRPPVLLLDEPTDGLDPAARDTVLELVSDHLSQTRCTILASTHLIYELDALADQVGVLSQGRLTAQMSRDALRESLRSYRIRGPEGWETTADIPGVLHRGKFGREHSWVIRGDQADLVARIAHSGGEVREVASLNLHDAVVHLMRQGAAS